jgi:hypothetical protein
MGIDALHRAGRMLMPGPGDVGIHIILGKADLPSDLIGMDLSPADQIIDGGFTDMEDVSNLLGGQGFVLCHSVSLLVVYLLSLYLEWETHTRRNVGIYITFRTISYHFAHGL